MAGKLTNRRRAGEKKDGSGGSKALSQAAYRLLEMKAPQIADSLMIAASMGEATSFRLLRDLASGNMSVEEAEAMRPFRQLLEDLAAEVQLPADALDKAEEDGQ
jgi:hypothetical protein